MNIRHTPRHPGLIVQQGRALPIRYLPRRVSFQRMTRADGVHFAQRALSSKWFYREVDHCWLEVDSMFYAQLDAGEMPDVDVSALLAKAKANQTPRNSRATVPPRDFTGTMANGGQKVANRGIVEAVDKSASEGHERVAGEGSEPAPDVRPIRYVVSLSSGASSAVAAQRVIDRYGRENVDLVFADTGWEDDDNYRFLWRLCQRWESITILADGRNPLQVAKDKAIIPNQKFAPCTAELKIKLFVDYLKRRQKQGYQVIVALGMGHNEQHRMEAPTRNYGEIGVEVLYPLVWSPVELDSVNTIKAWGIEPPRMYLLGYKHANCGGRCIKQGKRDWRRTLENYPERFAEVETWEREMRKDARFGDYAILRDESGGEVKPYTLEQLRLEVQARDSRQPRLWDMQDDLHGCSLDCGAGDPGVLKSAKLHGGEGKRILTIGEWPAGESEPKHREATHAH